MTVVNRSCTYSVMQYSSKFPITITESRHLAVGATQLHQPPSAPLPAACTDSSGAPLAHNTSRTSEDGCVTYRCYNGEVSVAVESCAQPHMAHCRTVHTPGECCPSYQCTELAGQRRMAMCLMMFGKEILDWHVQLCVEFNILIMIIFTP